MAEPGDTNPPLLRADEAPTEPEPAPAPPSAPAAQPPRPPWPPAPAAPSTVPAPPASPLAQSQVRPPPPPPSYGGYEGAPVPQPSPSASGWRRALAVLALVAMVAVAGGLLGAASRGSLFSDSSNASRDTALAPTAPSSDNQTGSSSTSGSSGGSSSSSAASGVSAALVNINTTLSGGGEGAGTGMVISSSGYVLTNNHVIANSTSIHVEIGGDGSSHTAKVIGYDVGDDVALIKINDVSGLDTIPVGHPDAVQENDDVTVLGNALGRGGSPTVTPGTVVALNKQITATDSDGSNPETLTNMIQVEADVQPGDSGGALVGNDGTVVGMTTAASVNGFRFQQTTTGVGFAIRIDKALGVADKIKNGDETDGVHVGGRALLGVSISGSGSGFSGSSGDGAFVEGVADNTPAADAGIQQGDTIVAIGDETIGSSKDLQDVMNGYHPGDKVSVSWVDGSGDTRHANLELVDGPPA